MSVMLCSVMPIGRLGSGIVKLPRLPSSEVGSPPAEMSLTWILLPDSVTRATPLSEKMPATLAVIFASLSLFRAIFRSATPAALDPALARLPKVISPVPSMLDTVPLLKPELSLMSLMVALMSSIVTGPAFSPVAVMWTSLKLRAASWVRNGKPWIDTSGLVLKPCFWIWVANWLSA